MHLLIIYNVSRETYQQLMYALKHKSTVKITTTLARIPLCTLLSYCLYSIITLQSLPQYATLTLLKKRYVYVSRETLYRLLYRIQNNQLGINQYYLHTNTTNYYIKPLLFNSHIMNMHI